MLWSVIQPRVVRAALPKDYVSSWPAPGSCQRQNIRYNADNND